MEQYLNIKETPRGKQQKKQEGDWSEVVIKHWGMATAIAMEYRNIPEMDFEDVLQHARLALTRAAMSFDTTRGASFSTYAWRVIQNELRSLYRRQQRRVLPNCIRFGDMNKRYDMDDDDAEQSFPDETTDTIHEVHVRETRGAVEKAMQKLSERSRKVLMGVMAGQNYRDIGLSMGFSKSSAKTLVCRIYQDALKTLRSELTRSGFHSTAIA